MTRLGGCAAALLAFASFTAGARVVERIVAVVNGEVILASELEDRSRPFMGEALKETDEKAREKKMEAVRREVLEKMVDDQLIEQQAADLKVQVSSDDVDKAVEDIRKQNNIDQDQLVEALRREGLTLATYRSELRKQITRIRTTQGAMRSRVSISDDDVKSYYDQNVRSAGAERKVRASHIFIQIPEGATVQVVEKKRNLAAQLVQRARAGEDFAKMARENSEDPATRHEGGDLGWFGKGALPPAVEEIVFAMDPGEVRGPVRAERGFHVIKLIDRKEEQARPFAEIKEQLRASLYQQEMEKQTRNWLQELRKKAHVEVRLGGEVGK